MKPFKDLTDEEKGTLLLAHHNGEDIEVFLRSEARWEYTDYPVWHSVNYYRVKSKPPTQDTIPWAAIHSDFKWAARDKDGEVYVYCTKPYREAASFQASDNTTPNRIDVSFAGYKRGSCDWPDSLQKRPEGKQND